MLVAHVQRPPMPTRRHVPGQLQRPGALANPCAPPTRNSSPTRSPPCRYESSGLNPVGIPRSPLARPARTSPSSCSSTPRRLTIRCPRTLDCPGVVTPTPSRPPPQPPGSLGIPRRLRIRRTAHLEQPSPVRCDPPPMTVDSPDQGACSSAGERCLHTAEATGSKPVTPTSTKRFLNRLPEPGCQQIASKPPTVVAVALKALSVSGNSLPAGERIQPVQSWNSNLLSCPSTR